MPNHWVRLYNVTPAHLLSQYILQTEKGLKGEEVIKNLIGNPNTIKHLRTGQQNLIFYVSLTKFDFGTSDASFEFAFDFRL